MPAKDLVLYSGPNCILCNKAEALLYRAGVGLSELQIVDVTSSLELKKKYGIQIPVVKRTDLEQELFWPFSLDSLQAYLAL